MNSDISPTSLKFSRLALRMIPLAALLFGVVSLSLPLFERVSSLSSQAVEEWRPMFLLWAGSFLAIGLLLRFRSAKNLPESSESSGANKILLSMAAVVLLLSTIYPTLSTRIANALERKWPATVSANAITLKLKFSDLDCADCVMHINSILRKQTGLEKAEISLEKREGTVWYNPDETSKTTVLELLQRNHYPAKETK